MNSPSNGEKCPLASSSLEVIMNRFGIIASPNCCSFLADSKSVVCNEMSTMWITL